MNFEQIECFEGFTGEQILKVEAIAEAVRYAPGEVIFNIDEPSEAFYLLESGAVQVEIPLPEEESVISILHPVSLFGEVGLLGQGQRSATVSAKDEVRVRRIRNDDFLALLENQPDMAARFYRTLSRILYRRVARTTERMVFYKIALTFQEHG